MAPIFEWLHRLATDYPKSAKIAVDPILLATSYRRKKVKSLMRKLAAKLKVGAHVVVLDDGIGFVEAIRAGKQ
jgi:hypothetical protein